MKFLKAAVLLLFLTFNLAAFAAQVYKYKDENGKWVFSDKKPKKAKDLETVEYQGSKKGPLEPRLYIKEVDDGGYALVFHNPYFAPIEVEMTSTIFESGVDRQVVGANSTQILSQNLTKRPRLKYIWRIGEPGIRQDNHLYRLPVSSKQSHIISQSFKGRFSHFRRPNIYSVDIALSVGTYISAARKGTVIWVKDNFHIGGAKSYFLDKANYINVLHEDGTYAVYAHILHSSALVKPGDTVNVGDRLARAGSTGYSTGPHLHFVIRKNSGSNTRSVPFRFADNSGKIYTPRRGMKVDGIDKDF